MRTKSCLSSHGTKKIWIFFGLSLVVIGLLFLSFNFGWIDSALKSVIFSWPMIFIVIGILGFTRSNRIISLFWLILGGFFLLPRIADVYPDSMQGVDGDFANTYWPVLLILLGIGFILKVLLVKHRKRERDFFRITNATEGVNGRIEKRVVFGGSESIFLDPVFHGGEISVVFGGVVLDLRKTQLPEGVTYLDVDAVFGGVVLYIPDDWLVETKLETVLGGFEDKRPALFPDKLQKLVLQGDLVFGGCEIR